jgi:hypothetical protein
MSELAVGKIMMATGLGTGRVMALARNHGVEQVVLGPVSLTDVVRDANISSAAPISLANPEYYSVPRLPGAVTDDPSTGGHWDSGTGHFASVQGHGSFGGFAAPPVPPVPLPSGVRSHLPSGVPSGVPTGLPSGFPTTLPPPTLDPPQLTDQETRTVPFFNTTGIGVHVYVKHAEGKFDAHLTLHVDAPTATFHLDVQDGKVVEAYLRIHGAGGISLDVSAAQLDASGAFAGKEIAVPVALTIPIGGPIPLHFSITQTLHITSQIIGRGSISGHADYNLSGDLVFGKIGNKPLRPKLGAKVDNALTSNTTALGVAPNSYELGWAVKASVGVGLSWFGASAWFQLGFAVNLTSAPGLDVLTPGCVTDSLRLWGQFGLSYRIPDILARALNAVLSLFGVKKKVPASGGVAPPPFDIWRPQPARYCPTGPSH